MGLWFLRFDRLTWSVKVTVRVKLPCFLPSSVDWEWPLRMFSYSLERAVRGKELAYSSTGLRGEHVLLGIHSHPCV